MIALTAGLTVKLLELSHPAAIVITSALLVSFPSVANTFAYMFTADPYFIALFMNTLAVWLTKKYRFGWIAAVGLITLACGIYQAYICYAAGLLLFDCTLSLLKDAPVKQVLRRGIGYAAILIASLLAYILITISSPLPLTGEWIPWGSLTCPPCSPRSPLPTESSFSLLSAGPILPGFSSWPSSACRCCSAGLCSI